MICMINKYLPCMFQQIESERPIKVEQLLQKKQLNWENITSGDSMS